MEVLHAIVHLLVLPFVLIVRMGVACRLGREVLDEAAAAVAPGVTTDEIDRIVHEATVDRECYPSPLNYYRFPKSCCTSVNEVICHGIPVRTKKIKIRAVAFSLVERL